MKEHLLSNKILFILPFFCLFTIFFLGFHNNFFINGIDMEFFLYEFFLLFLGNSLLVFFLYFILSKFIENKTLIAINIILCTSSLFSGTICKIIVLMILIISLLYKNNNIVLNAFLEIFSSLLFLTVFALFCFNVIPVIGDGISFITRIRHYNSHKKIKVEDNKKKPNIYWFHMDGMPNTGFMKKYYNKSLDDFHNQLINNDFIVNKDASFKGGFHTITALNSLLNPDYYDHYLKDYLDGYHECSIKKCKTKYISNYKDLVYRRLDNELFKALEKGDYSTIAITEFNQYTSLNADYIYDISNYSRECKLSFFKRIKNNDDIYKNILKLHFKFILHRYYDYTITNDDFYEKIINCNMNLDEYPNIKNGDFIPNKLIMNALNDSKNKNNKPKFYFIDNILMHKFWNYDSNGKIIREDNINLDDYDDTYEYTTKVLLEYINYIRSNDLESVIIIQGDHGIHVLAGNVMKEYFNIDDKEVLDIRNSTITAISIPDEFKNGDEDYLNNPLNISRYLINNYVGDNYDYLKSQ